MALSRKGKMRLNTLIAFMEKLPKSANKHFYMGFWFNHGGDHDHKFGNVVTKESLRHCGTTACALGWAATIPSFRKAGLYVETVVRGEKPFDRAKDFFDINYAQTAELFSPLHEAPKTPKQWAKQARALVREWSSAL